MSVTSIVLLAALLVALLMLTISETTKIQSAKVDAIYTEVIVQRALRDGLVVASSEYQATVRDALICVQAWESKVCLEQFSERLRALSRKYIGVEGDVPSIKPKVKEPVDTHNKDEQ